VPKKLNEYVLNDKILLGIDEATEKSLNGPRVTNMIPLLANKAKDKDGHLMEHDAYPTHSSNESLVENKFLIVLRCVRKWAKAKGLYGNKMGYLGGINCNLLVAMICQFYPHASPSNLLARFFFVYSRWPWPTPVMLNSIQPHPSFFGEKDKGDVWSPEEAYNQHMPIITPAYPAMNSALSVSTHTLGVMKKELVAGYEVCKGITATIKEKGLMGWDRLFEPSDFFIAYTHYLVLNIIANGNDSLSRGWIGFVESRIRTFLNVIEPLALAPPIHLYPKGSKTQKSDNSLCYFVGFDVDHSRLRADKTIDFNAAVSRFKSNGVNGLFDKFNKGVRPEGLDFVVEHVTWKKLPKEVWESFGGKEAAKAKRASMGFGVKKAAAEPTVGLESTAVPGGAATVGTDAEGSAESKEGDATAEAKTNDVATEAVQNDKMSVSRKRKQADLELGLDRTYGFSGVSVGRRPIDAPSFWPLPADVAGAAPPTPFLRPSEISWT
jgi:poly(A) polymerase